MRQAGAGSFEPNHLYFDISVFLRSDVYVVGKTDAYGEVTRERYLTPELWKKNSLNTTKGAVSVGSGWQFNVKHDLDLRQYLSFAVFGHKDLRNAALALCKKHGWTTVANGKSIEDALIVV